LANRVEPEYRSTAITIFGGVPEGEHHALITFGNYVVDSLKLFEIDPTDGLIVMDNWDRA
jgi:hypothetical protein